MQLPDLPESDDARTERTLPELPEVPDLDHLRSKSWEAKTRYDNQRAETEKRQRRDQQDAQGLGIGLVIAYTIAGVPLGGFVIGWIVDAAVGGNLFKFVGGFIGAVCGVILAIVMINKHGSR